MASQRNLDELKKDEALLLPHDLNYDAVGALSDEDREHLKAHRPASIGHASRIPGLTPSAAFLLLKHVNKHKERRTSMPAGSR